jgi:signal transduction histidine kinase
MKLKSADGKTLLHLDRIGRQVAISTAIIQSVQNLAKMKEPQKVAVGLAGVVEDAIAISEVLPGVEVVKKAPAGECFVDADPEQLLMVFRNIVTNAVQAMDHEGTLSVCVEKTDAGWVQVSFQDSGPGIAPEDLEKIFQPFFSTKAKGLGFGLAICQMIVEKHGGMIKARSKQGKGTTLIVRLPSAGTENQGG